MKTNVFSYYKTLGNKAKELNLKFKIRSMARQSTEAAQGIHTSIGLLNEASASISTSSSQVDDNAAELSRMAEGLQKLVGRFTV